jgi:hypothetical protein
MSAALLPSSSPSAVAPPTRFSRGIRLALLLPAAVGGFGSTLLQPDWFSPFAPVLGPWAGFLYGHSDCTLANAAPAWAAVAVALGLCALGAIFVAPTRFHWMRIAITANAAAVWSAAAWLSVVNTTS